MAKVNADRAKGIPQEGIKFQENRRSIGFNNPLLCAGVLCVYEYEYVCVCVCEGCVYRGSLLYRGHVASPAN